LARQIVSHEYAAVAVVMFGKPALRLKDARRTTRRAVAVGAGAAAAGAYYGSGCVQVVDAYGQLVTRC